MSHEHERPVEPFSDLHIEHGRIRATLLHDPTIEGLDVALYLDGSGSMRDEYENPKVQVRGGGFWWNIFGIGEAPVFEAQDNQVEPPARWILEYLASKDRNGALRVAYWACGSGREIQPIGELTAANAKDLKLPGPTRPGDRTELLPALEDFERYFDAQVKAGARQGCAVIITDGELHDADRVKAWSTRIAKRIKSGALPRINLILVGVGSGVKEEQLEDICHEEYAGIEHLWCHRVAEEIKQVAELVAALVDETMTVAAGGVIYDDKGRVVKRYEGRLPAVLEFAVPEGCTAFTLEVNGQKFTQPLPDEDEDHHEEEEEEDHH